MGSRPRVCGSGQFGFTPALNAKRSATRPTAQFARSCSILQNVAGRPGRTGIGKIARGALCVQQQQRRRVCRSLVVVVILVIWHQKAAVVELCFSATLISLTS
jgi:hypothetical protein